MFPSESRVSSKTLPPKFGDVHDGWMYMGAA